MKQVWSVLAAIFLVLGAGPLAAQSPLRITITEGTREPVAFAAPAFVAESARAATIAADLTDVVTANLTGSGLFRDIPATAHIGRITSFDAPVRFSDWSLLDAQLLITGSATTTADGQLVVKFRLWDVFAQAELGAGQQFVGPSSSWRRMAHRIADIAYERLTGEPGYFNSRIAFVSETGAKGQRRKRLAVMDQDGANLAYLTGDETLLLAPRWSPDNRKILYTSYASGQPEVVELDLATRATRPLTALGQVAFAPRYSPDGRQVVLSANDGSNTDIYLVDPATGARRRLTTSPAIETAPSFSPDGRQIVFESDRSGTQQLYVMPATGGAAARISSGPGRYGTPVWSPRGDRIAFTKINEGRFHIGVMRTDGSDERLLTGSFLEEAPSWAPNGRVLTFFRETQGAEGAPQIWSVDISGRNLRPLPTPAFASDPAWSGLIQ
ncbi:MAG: Tol-Pal system beta propeller repeat protein TolB [Pseudomonadota bacterium]